MNGVKTDDFAGQVKPEHLFLAILIDDITLEATRPHRGDGLEFVTRAEYVLTGLNRAGFIDDVFK